MEQQDQHTNLKMLGMEPSRLEWTEMMLRRAERTILAQSKEIAQLTSSVNDKANDIQWTDEHVRLRDRALEAVIDNYVPVKEQLYARAYVKGFLNTLEGGTSDGIPTGRSHAEITPARTGVRAGSPDLPVAGISALSAGAPVLRESKELGRWETTPIGLGHS